MTVVITKPGAGAQLSGTATVEATYSGKNFQVATLNVDGKQVGSDSLQPISFQLDTKALADGPHSLTVAVRYGIAGGKYRWQKASVSFAVKNGELVVWSHVAAEYESFTLLGVTEVRYGKGTAWSSKVLSPGSYACGNALFGDPIPGTVKECQVARVAADSAPTQAVAA